MHRFRQFLDQRDHKDLYQRNTRPAYSDFVNPERSGQEKKKKKSQQHQEFPSGDDIKTITTTITVK